MAKAFLIRWGTQNDFDAIKLLLRELGFAVDSEKLYIGGEDENIHIPKESYVRDLILGYLPKYAIPYGDSLALDSSQVLSGLGYNTVTEKLSYRRPVGSPVNIVIDKDMPAQTSTTFKVLLENIDTGDSNSVTLTGYNRPIEMIFRNGILCTTHADDEHRYVVDRDLDTLKIYNCLENDIIAYF
jgi:hypothetical protein